MPVVIQDNGKNNRIQIDPKVSEHSDAVILLSGSANHVDIASGVSLLQARISLGDRCSLTVSMDCSLAAIEIIAINDSSVFLGKRSTFTWSTRIYLHEASCISIGSDCLIASDTLMMASDMHSIVDIETKQRINPAADIVICDNVWLAHECTVLKGSRIGSGSVVGYRSTVSGVIPANSLAVGSPARVIKSGVTWDRNLL